MSSPFPLVRRKLIDLPTACTKALPNRNQNRNTRRVSFMALQTRLVLLTTKPAQEQHITSPKKKEIIHQQTFLEFVRYMRYRHHGLA